MKRDYEQAAARIDAARKDAPASMPPATWPDWGQGADNPETAAPRDVALLCASSLTPKPVAWLWDGWLSQGKLQLLAGEPGQGKTTLAMAMCATVTTGGRWPDGSRCRVGNVLVWSGEDDLRDTLLPRLLASGADPSRVFFVGDVATRQGPEPFNPATDLPALEAKAQALPGGVALIVIDPIVSAVTGDSNKNAEVRRALQPVVDMASRLGAAVLGIHHFSKGGQGGDPASRVLGSVAFTAVARLVLVAAKNEGQERRIFARAKSNIGPDSGGFSYSIAQAEPLPGIHASYVLWGEAVEGSARELLADTQPPSDEDRSAATLLRQALAGGEWVPMKTVEADLMAQGFSKKQVWSASRKVGVERSKRNFAGGWEWRLLPQGAQDSAQDSEDSIQGNGESWKPSRESSGGVESSEPTTTAMDVEEF